MQIPLHELEILSKFKIQTNAIWIYSNQIKPLPNELLDENKCCLVYIKQLNKIGIYCKKSLIAVKILNFFHTTEKEISTEKFTEAVLNHLKYLQSFKNQFAFVKKQEAFRLSHGDHDGLPSITIDDYKSVRVIQSSSALGEFIFPFVVKALSQLDNIPLFERSTGQIRLMDGLPERTRWVSEGEQQGNNFKVTCAFANLTMDFHLNKAQKTGLFLDQRLNLNFLSQLLEQRQSSSPVTPAKAGVQKLSMLDVCSYAGAWSAVGAKNGIENFILIDQDAFALTLAKENIQLNSTCENLNIETLHGDMFEHLSLLSKQNKSFDVVIADPPAFAKSSKHIFEAKKAYTRLIRLAASCTNKNGYLIVCSCSRHMSEEMFFECLTQALGSQQNDWVLLHKGEQSPCHTRLVKNELSDYLKCYFLQRL